MRWEDGRDHGISQVYSDMTGWQELTEIVATAYKSLPENEKQNCTFYCQRNYGYAGAIHLYGDEHNLPEPVTFLESYVFWAPETIPGSPVIYVYYNSDEMQSLFNSISEVGAVNNPWFREKGVKVFLCSNPKTDVKKVYETSATIEKTKFQKQ